MKRRDLIKLLEEHGLKYDGEGANHTLYRKEGIQRPIPVKRHREIPEYEVQRILKEAGIK